MPVSPEKIRDELFRRKFEEKLRLIQAVREKHTFIDYTVNRPLLDELAALIEENQSAYEQCYEAPLQRLEAIKNQHETIKASIHPLRFYRVQQLITETEKLLAAEDYAINARAIAVLGDLDTHIQKAREEYSSWEKNLESWRLRLKEVMLIVWAEDYALLKAHYQEVRQTLHSDQLPPAEIRPDEEAIHSFIQKRTEAFSRLKKKAAISVRLLKKVEEAENTFFPLSEFMLLEKEVERKTRTRVIRMAAVSLSGVLMIVLGYFFLPPVFNRWQDTRMWAIAASENSLQSYQLYVNRFPRGKHIVEAYDAMNRMPEGKIARFTDQFGSVFSYEGELSDLKPQGKGKAIYSDSSVYDGYWTLGIRDSFGMWQDTLGGSYEGEWKNGIRQGKGKYRYHDGSIYEGTWKNNEIEGQGTMVYADGSKYTGTWKAGLPDGKGILTFGNGGVYSGFWKEGKYHQSGKLTDTTGVVYDGQWTMGNREGEGRQTWPDGKEYIGKWKSDQPHGEGVLTWPSGSKFSCTWVNGLIDGNGIFVSRFRDEYKGLWKGTIDSLMLYDGQGNLFKQGKIADGLFIGE
ncbi:MAG: hypothetical protein R3C61_16160 [Bacteroidia bacterium]